MAEQADVEQLPVPPPDPRALVLAQAFGPGAVAILGDMPKASLGEGLEWIPPTTPMSGEQLEFQLRQLTERAVVCRLRWLPNCAPAFVAATAHIAARDDGSTAFGLRFSPIFNGVEGTEPYNGRPFFCRVGGDGWPRIAWVASQTAWLREQLRVARQAAPPMDPPTGRELTDVLRALNASLDAASPLRSAGGVSLGDDVADGLARRNLPETAANNLWRPESVTRALMRNSLLRPLSADELRVFSRAANFGAAGEAETREVGVLLALHRMLAVGDDSGVSNLVTERLHVLLLRYGENKNKALANELEAALAADLHATHSGAVTRDQLLHPAPDDYVAATIKRSKVSFPGLPAKYSDCPRHVTELTAERVAPFPPVLRPTECAALKNTSLFSDSNHSSQASPLPTTVHGVVSAAQPPSLIGGAPAKAADTSLHLLPGGARPKCPKCGSPVSDGCCTAVLCNFTATDPASPARREPSSAVRPATTVPTVRESPPPGLPNDDGSCALNAALTALSALRDRVPKRSTVEKLLHSAWNGEAKSKVDIAQRLERSGWTLCPGRTCARECIAKILEIAPNLAALAKVLDVATTFDGAKPGECRFLPDTVGAALFRGPPPGHWIGATLRGKTWYVVDDLQVSRHDPDPAFQLAAVVVENSAAAAVEGALKSNSGSHDDKTPAATPLAPLDRAPCTAMSKKGRRCVAAALTGHELCAAHLYPAGASSICGFSAANGKNCGNWAAIGFGMCGQHIEATCRANREPFPAPAARQPHAPAIDASRRDAALAAAPAVLAAASASYVSPTRAPAQPQGSPPPYFRVGHQSSVPLVTMMTGADLVAMTQNRKDLAALSDTYISGISVEQRRDHLKWLQKLHEMPERHRPRPLPEAVLATMRMYRLMGRPWKDTTWARALGTVDGALRRLSIYTDSVIDVNLSRTSAWQDAARQASKLKKSQHKRKAIPATLQEVKTTVTRLTTENAPDRALQLALMWSTCARPGCTLQLKAEDVHIDNEATGDVTIVFRRGKRQELGLGPLPVHTRLPTEWLMLFKQHVKETSPASFMWSYPTRDARFAAVTVLTHDLRKTNPRLEARSLRVGSLRAMAEAQISEERMLEFSGHQTVESLREYISYSEIVKDRAKTMRRAAAHLLSGPP